MEHLESLNPGELCKLSQPVPRKPKPGDGRGKIMRYPKDTFLLAHGKGLELFPKIRTSQDVPRWAEPSRWTECFRERDWDLLDMLEEDPIPCDVQSASIQCALNAKLSQCRVWILDQKAQCHHVQWFHRLQTSCTAPLSRAWRRTGGPGTTTCVRERGMTSRSLIIPELNVLDPPATPIRA